MTIHDHEHNHPAEEHDHEAHQDPQKAHEREAMCTIMPTRRSADHVSFSGAPRRA
jgi:hypothetical protein